MKVKTKAKAKTKARTIDVKPKVNEYCEAFGIAYFAQDEECSDCDEAMLCKKLTDERLKSKTGGETMDTDKLLKKAKKIKKKEDLLEFIEENELDVKVGKKESVSSILKKVTKALEEAAEEEETGEEEEEEIDLDELDRKELKAYIKNNELDVKVTKKMSDDDIRLAIVEALEEAGGEDEEEEEEEAAEEETGGEEEEGASESEEEEEEPTIDDLKERVKALEARVAEIKESMEGSTTAAKSARGSKKAEKEEAKQKLLEGAPYSDSDLKAMTGRDLKMLGSALGVNTFGMKTEEVLKVVKQAQKKSGGKKSSGGTKSKKKTAAKKSGKKKK